MFRANKYTSLLAITALASTNSPLQTQAIRTKADTQWHLAMVPDTDSFFEAPSSFLAGPRHFGFGLSADPFFRGGSFAEDGPTGFGDFGMPSMQDMMRDAEQGFSAQPGSKSNSWSSSSSSSYSSSIGADGKKHEKSTKQGQQTVCKDGRCKVITCENGKCQEHEVDSKQSSDGKSSGANLLGANPNKLGGSMLSDSERQMQDSFSKMNQRMRKMEEGFANMERNMAASFRDMPKRMEAMARNGIAGSGNDEGHTQSYSSSFSESVDQDGKVHKKESKQGSEMECHNGQCRGTVCKNGVCHEISYDAKSKASKKLPSNQKNVEEFIVEVPSGTDPNAEVDGPRGITKEEFKRILQKIKEHMKQQGIEGGDVVIKIVPMDSIKQKQQADATPPPPPAFAPKNR